MGFGLAEVVQDVALQGLPCWFSVVSTKRRGGEGEDSERRCTIHGSIDHSSTKIQQQLNRSQLNKNTTTTTTKRQDRKTTARPWNTGVTGCVVPPTNTTPPSKGFNLQCRQAPHNSRLSSLCAGTSPTPWDIAGGPGVEQRCR